MMSMMPPYAYVKGWMAEERMKDAMREGDHARLMRMARPVRRGPVSRLMGSAGGLLVSSRKNLQARVPRRSSLVWGTRRCAHADDETLLMWFRLKWNRPGTGVDNQRFQ
jgi:hypothetical protein